MIIDSIVVVICVIGLSSAIAQYPQSPCPNIFSYRKDQIKNQIYGHIQIRNLEAEQLVKLNVDLAIGARPPLNNIGSITLVKSRADSYVDIIRGLPAQYRINFPMQNPLPQILSIVLNGQTICTGRAGHGRNIRALCWKHTWYTQLLSQNMAKNDETTPNAIALQPNNNLLGRGYVKQTSISPPTSQKGYTCGKPSAAILNRLSINGHLVIKGQFPWIVPLFDRMQPQNPKYICGSTIITKKYLVTAAHCVYGIDDFMPAERILAVPGMYNTDNFLEENAEFVTIEKVIPHHEYVYDDDGTDADLAVLRLEESLEYSDYIIPICLWRGDNDLFKIVGQEGIVAGWGYTEQGPSTVPTYIRTTIMDRQQCNENWSRMYTSTARIFCGDGHGSVPCNGDSGSGLVMKRGNQFYLRGVVSRGKVDKITLKCDATKYAVYTDIAPFRFWMKSVMS
ncbi:chymotrypsin-like protease CTRL-1 isoform X2 [Topomyia yanbarensis]|uniref:chymotrypsin-like protease CTRL-1 isoform X2 n=1 Tax=Topomyia yanbarensis TaxID=2498891 RepID=UPI00273AE75B|nr:chymotrypsin-like protease CTRL-1 isoform X2 [Topomyia yanbarensis]